MKYTNGENLPFDSLKTLHWKGGMNYSIQCQMKTLCIHFKVLLQYQSKWESDAKSLACFYAAVSIADGAVSKGQPVPVFHFVQASSEEKKKPLSRTVSHTSIRQRANRFLCATNTDSHAGRCFLWFVSLPFSHLWRVVDPLVWITGATHWTKLDFCTHWGLWLKKNRIQDQCASWMSLGNVYC